MSQEDGISQLQSAANRAMEALAEALRKHWPTRPSSSGVWPEIPEATTALYVASVLRSEGFFVFGEVPVELPEAVRKPDGSAYGRIDLVALHPSNGLAYRIEFKRLVAKQKYRAADADLQRLARTDPIAAVPDLRADGYRWYDALIGTSWLPEAQLLKPGPHVDAGYTLTAYRGLPFNDHTHELRLWVKAHPSPDARQGA